MAQIFPSTSPTLLFNAYNVPVKTDMKKRGGVGERERERIECSVEGHGEKKNWELAEISS